MDLKIKDKKVLDIPVPYKGRLHRTFTPTDPNDTLKMIHPDTPANRMIGDIVIRQVQLEKGNSFTSYSENTAQESMLGAMFKGLKEVTSYVTDEDGNRTKTIKETMRSTFVEYENIKTGKSNQTLSSENGLYQMIEDALTGNFNRLVRTSDIFSSELVSRIENMPSSKFVQMNNLIEMALFGSSGDQLSKLALGEKQIHLKSDMIRLSGDTVMDKAYADKFIAVAVEAQTFKAQSANIMNAIIGGLTANSITANVTNFVESIFNGINNRLRITGDGISITDNYGRSYIEYANLGMNLKDSVGNVGRIGMINEYGTSDSIKESIIFGAYSNKSAVIGWFDSYGDSFVTAIDVRGTGKNGRIRFDVPVFLKDSSTYGLRLFEYDNEPGTGWRLTKGSASAVAGVYISESQGPLFIDTDGSYISARSIKNRLSALERR